MTAGSTDRRAYLGALASLATLGIAGCVGGSENPESDGEIDRDTDSTLRFDEVSRERGITYELGDRSSAGQKMIGNAGVYAVDHDRSGWTDVLLVGGERPILYENVEGTFRESDALPALDGDVRVALFFDHDNDGYDDVLLLRTDEPAIFLENTGTEFVVRDVGLEQSFVNPIAAAAGDYTGNGLPDVFVAQNGDWDADRPRGLMDFPIPPAQDNGLPNRLFAGDGSTFRETTNAAGITGDHWSLATSFVDFDGNGLADIHVANDFQQDAFYANRGDGTFEKRWLGRETDRNGMSSVVTDFTRDGHPDIFVTNIWFPEWVSERVDTTMRQRAKGNNVLVNRGDGTFEDRAEEYGLERGGWGWAAIVADLDNDGYRDVLHTTQYQHFRFPDNRITDQEIAYLHQSFPFFSYPALFQGVPDGFVEVDASEHGFESTDGRGLATLDMDRDGRVDVVLADMEGPHRLYRNRSEVGNAIQVEVRGEGDTPALGATVSVTSPAGTFTQIRDAKSDFLSQSSRVLHFGLGDVEKVTVAVAWPGGVEEMFDAVSVNQRLIVSPRGIHEIIPFGA